MKNLELTQMEIIRGQGDIFIGIGQKNQPHQIMVWVLGLAAGVASGFNPLVGGLTALGCMLTQ